jgi:cbb3-type cytochrome oxidase subunit 3
MNPLYRALANGVSPDQGVVMGLVTLMMIVLFGCWVWYAYAPSRRAQMAEFARLPLDGD